MARISYTGDGSPYIRMLNHSPGVKDGIVKVRDAIAAGPLPARLRVLSTLTADRINDCHY
ncbi:MAG TPA: hypothetical protein VFM93_09250 [Candidatus Limnocylindria bacterium]|nr:hypothetical protein [Candidatus Limnocylindria bacterium]